ncbi:MAG: OmpH family outer membrane protein [Planctomycetota bacterium]|nr:MAG: OmpH family outer membrane protein [Planctomycetota bacterium]
MNDRARRWVGLFVVAVLAAAGARAAHAQQAAAPRIGVVDLARVFKDYKKSAVLEEKINGERDQLKAELDGIKKKISDLNKELDLLDFGSDSYRAKEEEKARLVGLYELKKRRLEDRIKRRWQEYNVELLDDIGAVVSAYGKEHGYTLILKVDTDPSDEQKLLAGLRNVLYFAEQIDITDQVVAILNRRYQLEGGKAARPAGGSGGRGAATGDR